MANLKTDSAMNALNENSYINKLYDTNNQTQQDLIRQNYTENTGFLQGEQDRVQKQTNEYVDRTEVEARSAQGKYTGPKLSQGAQQQQALSRGNARQANINALQQQQSDADEEIERQRQLLASQYEAAIKKAQADNDMVRAQQLYNAAKNEEAKLLELRRSAASFMSSAGDNSIRNDLLKGNTPKADYSGKTWKQVLKNEAAINEIYDAQLESERLALQTEKEEAMSDLAAKQREQLSATDRKLTDAYVDALRKQKNYAEVQTAYGQGSGTAGAARIAQDTELQKTLTDLRGLQMGADARIGMEGLDIGKKYREQLEAKTGDTNNKRAEELIKAAEKEEEALYKTQLQIGQEMAQQGDYTVLGKLYGLSKNQIKKLKDASKRGGGGYGGGYYSKKSGDKKDPTFMEKANVAYHTGENMTRFVENHSSGGRLEGGNLTDYLAIYT